MREKLEKRLDTLKSEFESGQKMLRELDAQRNELTQKMMRISGAIQVLEEELGLQKEEGPINEEGFGNQKIIENDVRLPES